MVYGEDHDVDEWGAHSIDGLKTLIRAAPAAAREPPDGEKGVE